MRTIWILTGLIVLMVGCVPSAVGQFVESFDDGQLDGWETQTGDGRATMSLEGRAGHAVVTVDATEDRHNIWWAVLRRDVATALDLNRLRQSDTELRVTARIRVSHAPRRVNLSLNTQRTTDYHSNLMEFDIPDTTRWRTIHFTTDGFDARPGDTVNAQVAIIDWGRQTYRTAVDSFAVEVVDATEAGTASNRAVPYPLPIRDPDTLTHHVPAAQAGLVNRQFPETRLSDWRTTTDSGTVPTWTVTTDQYLLLRWDRAQLPNKPIEGPGILELTRQSVQTADTAPEELGQVRLVEITGGSSAWVDSTVTSARFAQGQPLHDVLNPQPIVDREVSGPAGESVRIPLSEPVLHRLTSGEAKGLALRPLGPVSASFYAGETFSPVLHFDVEDTGR